MGAKIYNELPIEIRKTESISDYSNLLKNSLLLFDEFNEVDVPLGAPAEE